MTGLLFITAEHADHKAINRMLLYLRNWEYGEPSYWDDLYLVTSRDAKSIPPNPEGRNSISGTSPPVPPSITNDNAWKGASIKDVEAFMLSISDPDAPNPSYESTLWFCVDDKGLADGTCIVAERHCDLEAEPIKYSDKWNKVRLPWGEVSLMQANLEIGNMAFDEYCDGNEPDAEGWWVKGDELGEDISEENVRKRNETVEEFKRCDRA
jgi:hypothetical protein